MLTKLRVLLPSVETLTSLNRFSYRFYVDLVVIVVMKFPRDKFHCFVNTSTKDWHSDATARTCFEQGKSIPGMVNPKTLMGIGVSLVQAESRMLGFCHILPVAAALAGSTLFHNNGEQFLQWQPGHDRGLPHRAFQVLKWYIVHPDIPS